MSIASIFWQERTSLVQSFHIAIIHGMITTWKRCNNQGATPQEPDFVGGLVLESTPLFYSALKSILRPHGISISVSGVFCHQTPQVAFDPPQKTGCELGDILFVYVHTPKVGASRRNALLCQAKASAKQTYRLVSADKVQLRLYTDWPDFVYQRSSCHLTGQKRSVTPKSPHAGAQYLLIDDRPLDDPMSGLLGFPGTYPIGCCMPDEFLHDHNHLAYELFDLFLFRSGRPFEDRHSASAKKDWSQIVWDLIDIGVRKSFNRKNSGRYKSSRIAGEILGLLDGSSFNRASASNCFSTAAEVLGGNGASTLFGRQDGPPDNSNTEKNHWEPEAGVSVVLIETSERPPDE